MREKYQNAFMYTRRKRKSWDRYRSESMYHEPLGWFSWSFRTCTDSIAVKRSALLDDLWKDWGKSAEYTRRLVSVNSVPAAYFSFRKQTLLARPLPKIVTFNEDQTRSNFSVQQRIQPPASVA